MSAPAVCGLRTIRFWTTALALAGLSAGEATAWGPPVAPPAPGLVRIPELFLLGTGILAYEPPPVDLLPRERWQLELTVAAANTFTRSDSVQLALELRGKRDAVDRAYLQELESERLLEEPLFLLDGELLTTRLRVRRGLGRKVELEVTVPLHRLHGGRFDSLVEGFHGALGVDQDGRQGVPRDQFLLFLQATDGELLVEDSPGARLGDVVISARKAFSLPWRSLRLLADGSVKLPTGDRGGLASSGSVDAMLQALMSRCHRQGCAHAGGAVRWLGTWPRLHLGEQVVLSGLVGYDLRLSDKMSLAAQLSFAESPYDDLGLEDVASDAFQLAIGCKRVLASGQELSVALVENLLHFENGADIGLQIGFAQRF